MENKGRLCHKTVSKVQENHINTAFFEVRNLGDHSAITPVGMVPNWDDNIDNTHRNGPELGL